MQEVKKLFISPERIKQAKYTKLIKHINKERTVCDTHAFVTPG